MKRALKSLAVAVAVSSGLWAVGVAAARRFERGRGVSEADDFRVAAFWGGREFSSTAAGLRSGAAMVLLGGADIDLSDSIPDPEGARLSLRAYLGGVQVTVPPTWRVEVTRDVQAGEIELRVPDPADLPADAPRLSVGAVVRGGGVLITAPRD